MRRPPRCASAVRDPLPRQLTVRDAV